MVMQFQSELEMQVGQGEAESPSVAKRKTVRSRKMTVRLTEELYDRLCTATDRPGVGKSMVVEAALERFLSAAPSAEDVIGERFDDMGVRFDRLERDMRMVAETVALHARYHLAVLPPISQSRQREAVLLGDERFKVLAEQVDRRVRLSQPLMQETIDRLNSRNSGESQPTVGERHSGPSNGQHNPAAKDADVDIAITAAAGEVGSNSYFRRLPH